MNQSPGQFPEAIHLDNRHFLLTIEDERQYLRARVVNWGPARSALQQKLDFEDWPDPLPKMIVADRQEINWPEFHRRRRIRPWLDVDGSVQKSLLEKQMASLKLKVDVVCPKTRRVLSLDEFEKLVADLWRENYSHPSRAK